VSFVKPTVQSDSRVFIQNIFCNFWTFLQISMNFGSLHYYLGIKSIEKRLNRRHSVGPQSGPHAAARRPAAHGRLSRGSAVARRPRAHRRLACRGVEGDGTRAVGGVRRARWEMARLTKEVGRRWGGGGRLARRCSDGGGRSNGGWRCSTLHCGSVSGRKR
jgi:hypothetical protein